MIADNYKIVEEKIAERCINTGRNRSDIKLIAVSKTQPNEKIISAINTGLIHFGENKAQELNRKSVEIEENLIWHFIGHLQTNKVKYIIDSAEYIHSVDSIKLANEIDKRAGKIEKVQKVLLEINTSLEASKFGLTRENEIIEIAEHCENCGSLKLSGLMTMAPYTRDESVIRESFAKLRMHFDFLNNRGFDLKELSMGMTNDYEIAVDEGATMLRVGTAIFGARDYS